MEMELRNRFTLFPIQHIELWKMYKKHMACFWTPEEIDLMSDLKDWDNLTDNEKFFIKHILSFFVWSDGVVSENLAINFYDEIQIPEVRCFYSFQLMIEQVHCVTENTLILTNKGYSTIGSLETLKRSITIWNGYEFSEVMVLFTGNKEIYGVTLSNGMELECTEDHKWILTSERKPTKELKVNDVLMSYDYPILDPHDPSYFQNPYIHGFFCGNGGLYNGIPYVSLYGKKKNLFRFFYETSSSYVHNQNSCTQFFIMEKINKMKSFVPTNYSIKTKIEWLSGYLDSLGIFSFGTNKTFLKVVSPECEFIKHVQLLLTTMNVQSEVSFVFDEMKIDDTENGKQRSEQTEPSLCILKVSECGIQQLLKLGLKMKTIDIQQNINIESITSEACALTIKKITKKNRIEKTFCFNEPKNHSGIFNGIMTGQSEVYSLLIDTYVKEEKEKHSLFNSINSFPCVKKKAEWCFKWMNKDLPLIKRIVAFSCIEGIFFSGAFCSIFWLKKRGLMPGLSFSNELISRDEGLHTDFACMLYKQMLRNSVNDTSNKHNIQAITGLDHSNDKNKLHNVDTLSHNTDDPSRSNDENKETENKETENKELNWVYDIVIDAVSCEKDFICESLPCKLIGMNSYMMSKYIEFVADRLLVSLGHKKVYFSKNPFSWMELISLQGKTNFFERRVSEYQKYNVMNSIHEVVLHKPNKSAKDDDDLVLDEDF